MAETEKPLPCPFCGGKRIRFDKHGQGSGMLHAGETIWSMCCYDCGATFPNMYSKEALLAKWNHRLQSEARVAEKIDDAFQMGWEAYNRGDDFYPARDRARTELGEAND